MGRNLHRWCTYLHIIRNDTLNVQKHADEILRSRVVSDAATIGDSLILIHNNARYSTARLVENMFETEQIQRVECPACSPDLNAIDMSGTHSNVILQSPSRGTNTSVDCLVFGGFHVVMPWTEFSKVLSISSSYSWKHLCNSHSCSMGPHNYIKNPLFSTNSIFLGFTRI